MRFSLRTLMLLFPALIVSYGLAYGCVRVELRNSCSLQTWHNQLNMMSIDYEMAQETKQTISVTKANQWFQGRLKAYNTSNWWLVTREDNWGNPIRCVALDEQNQPLPNVDSTMRYGFYSCGEDGISHSHGNDSDDLNTWNSTNDYYVAWTKQWCRECYQRQALWLTPWYFGGILFFWWLNHFVRRQKFADVSRD